MAPPSQRPTRTCATKNAPNNKSNQPNQNASFEPDDLDNSILAEPLNVGVKNVAQIASILKGGTTEVKDYLLNECNIIFECRKCTNLFRSIANFIAHKRIYCKGHLCEQMSLYEASWFDNNVPRGMETVQDNVPDDSDSIVESAEETQPSNESGERTTFHMQLSPRKSIIPRRSSVAETSSNTGDLPSIVTSQPRKRKSLDSIVKNLSKLRKEQSERTSQSLSNGINPTLFYSSESSQPSNGQSTMLNGNQINDNVDDGSAKKKQKMTREFVLLQNKPTTKKKSIQNYQYKNYKDVVLQLQEEVDKLRPAGSTGPLHDHEQLLPDQTLNQIYACNNYLFECPHCSIQSIYFSSAIRHLLKAHRYSKSKAKWTAFLHSRVADEEAKVAPEQQPVPKEQDQALHESQPVKVTIVKINEQYHTISEKPEAVAATSSNGNIDVHLGKEQDVIDLELPSTSNSINGVNQNGSLEDFSNAASFSSVLSGTDRILLKKRPKKQAKGQLSASRNGYPRINRSFAEIRAQLSILIAEEERNLVDTSKNEITLPDDAFGPLFSCLGYRFVCPDCDIPPVAYYGNAYRHLLNVHKMPKYKAKWVAFQNGQVVPDTEFPNGTHNGLSNGITIAELATTNGHPETEMAQEQQSLVAANEEFNESLLDFKEDNLPTNSLSSISHSGRKRHLRPTATDVNCEVITLSDDEDNGAAVNDGIGAIEDVLSEWIPLSGAPDEIRNSLQQPNSDYQCIFDIQELDAALSSGSITGEGARFELSHPVQESLREYGNFDQLVCSKCPGEIFLEEVSLSHHIALRHCRTMIMFCRLCKKYSTVHMTHMKAHLLDEHNVGNTANHNGTINGDDQHYSQASSSVELDSLLENNNGANSQSDGHSSETIDLDQMSTNPYMTPPQV